MEEELPSNSLPSTGFIDDHIFAKLRKFHILPSELCGDGEFLRFIHRRITGFLMRTRHELQSSGGICAETVFQLRCKQTIRLLEIV